MPIPFDDLAAHLHPSYQCLERRQRHRAARYLLAPPRLSLGVEGVRWVENYVRSADLGGVWVN